MLSKNKIRFINSLQKKKVRDDEQLYVIEGDKIVKEFIAARMPVKYIFAKPEFLKTLPLLPEGVEATEISYDELKLVSTLKTPHNALAIIGMQEIKLDIPSVTAEICCALDSIQDPGNLGTIIRAAAWFGIKNIICSPDSVDVYNPKVVQSTMGAVLHVNVYYNDLNEFLSEAVGAGIKVFGTLLNGKSIYSHPLSGNGIILLGNESRGITAGLLPMITDSIMIPGAGNKPGIDSLNVGMAASVVFSEFSRRKLNI
jgi:TrmH family RNA methyltransferase